MKPNYRTFFVLTRKPFGSDLAPKEIMQAVEVLGMAKRLEYAIRLGALALVTGNMGSGKPTAYQIIWVTASLSRAVLTKLIRKQVLEVAQERKKKPVLIVDAASLIVDAASLPRL
ncbi:hypothetical protein DFAR_3710029 [Desulfarculales bacterium]